MTGHRRRGRRLCPAGFFRPQEPGPTAAVGLRVVTAGSRTGARTAKPSGAGARRYRPEPHGLSVRLAGALAQYRHPPVHGRPGTAGAGTAGAGPGPLHGLFPTGYRGCRCSPGDPARPNPQDRAKNAQLPEPERTGVRLPPLSPEFQPHPGQSTDAVVVLHHPVLHHSRASYFNAGGRP